MRTRREGRGEVCSTGDDSGTRHVTIQPSNSGRKLRSRRRTTDTQGSPGTERTDISPITMTNNDSEQLSSFTLQHQIIYLGRVGVSPAVMTTETIGRRRRVPGTRERPFCKGGTRRVRGLSQKSFIPEPRLRNVGGPPVSRHERLCTDDAVNDGTQT